MSSIVFSLARIIGYSLFFAMMVIPTILQEVKLVLLLLTLGIILIRSFVTGKGTLHLHPVVFLYMLFFITVGSIFIFRGLISGAPGAIKVATVYVVWPLVFTLLISGIVSDKILNGLFRVMVFASIMIGFMGLIIISQSKGIIPDTTLIQLYENQSYVFGQGFATIQFKPIDSLLFLLPFTLAALITWPLIKKSFAPRYLLWIAFTLGLIMTVLSFRVALLTVVTVSPFITLVFLALIPSSKKVLSIRSMMHIVVFIAVLLMGINVYLDYNYDFNLFKIYDVFIDKFNFEVDDAQILRKEQFIHLIDGFLENPLLGAGHGAGVGYVRSEEEWAYELYYVALLYQVGTIGFLAYLSIIVWVYWEGIRIIREGSAMCSYMVSAMVGMTCLLIANATNIYLLKFDFMWTIFLPIGIINYSYIIKSKYI
jgi:hypothetical protein